MLGGLKRAQAKHIGCWRKKKGGPKEEEAGELSTLDVETGERTLVNVVFYCSILKKLDETIQRG